MSDLDLIIQAAKLGAAGSDNCNQVAAAIQRHAEAWGAANTKLGAISRIVTALFIRATDEREITKEMVEIRQLVAPPTPTVSSTTLDTSVTCPPFPAGSARPIYSRSRKPHSP